jgi:hypothetical protein
MKHYLSRLSARIRAICILSALFLVPDIVQAEDVYLLTSQDINGTTGNYNVPNNHKFTNSSGTVYTYTITSMPATGFSFRIGVQGWDKDMQPYTDGDALPINGDSYSITTDCYGEDKAWKVSYTKGEYNSLTITVDLSTSKRYVKITGVKSSTGGGSSTSGDESADNSDTESTTAGYGVPDNFGGVILRYNSSTEPTNGNLYDWKDYFSVAYLTPDSKGFKSTFAPYFSNLIKDVSSHSEKEDGWDGYVVSMSQSSHPLSLTAYGNPKFLIGNWSNSTSWSVGSELNYTKTYLEKINSSYAGMLDFPLHTFIYNIEQGKYSDASVKGWQALTYLSQIAPTNNNRSSVVGSGRSNDGIYNRLGVTFVNNDKVNNISGVENIKKAYAVILTSPGTPVVNYTDLTNNDLNDNILRLIKIRQWAGVKNTSSFETSEDKNYNNAYDYHIKGDFADLKVVVGDEAYVANYEKNGNNGSTSGGTDDRNNAKFGGDGYNYTLLDEGTGWRVWYRNNNNTDAIHVAISPEGGLKTGTVNCTGQVIGIAGSGERKFAYTTDGTAPVLGASNTKMVTYTWNSTTQSGKIDDFSSTHSTVVANGGYVTVIAQAIKDGALTGAIDTVTYRFNDYVPLNATITPTTATVNYAASLTPKVGVVGTDAKTRTYAFTIDGSDPTIVPATGEGTGKTVVRTYDYDAVVPTSDVYTFYMSSADTLTYIDFDGKEHHLEGNTVTVKAQAVQTITEGSKYRLEGDIATGTYTFKTAGIKPAGSYTISVKNDDEANYEAGKPSINKVTATVTVTNTATGKDDDVDVFYTIDGSDPAKVGNAGARLVNKDRKIEVYGIVNLEHNAENYIRVAIAGSKPLDEGVRDDDGKTHASCPFDLTCSTSEGEYKTYRENNTDPSLKTYGGDGHIVVYILPWSSKYLSQQDTSGYIWVQNALQGYQSKEDLEDEYYGHNISHVAGLRVPFIYAYENIVKDGVVESKALTHATHTIDVFTDMAVGLPPIPNQENQENQEEQEEQETNPPYCWYYVDLVPDDNYKEVNVEVGYYDLVTGKWEFTPATIANVHNDMFLKFDVATGQIQDVTHEFTGDHFYTIGENGTKSEPANPMATEHFFYVQVPEAWTINGNSVKVLQNGTVLDGATVDVQGSAETSCLSKVCKISVPALTEGTKLTIKPYNGTTPGQQKLTVNYVNGGYYFYESATHYTTNAPLVFSADADGVVEDQRPYGHRDVNHTKETTPGARVKKEGCSAYGDFTYYLTPNWKDASDKEVPTTTVTDNWNGKPATVNTIAAGTTISQTVDLHTAGQGLYTVQMIVRGTANAKATLQLEGSEYKKAVWNDLENKDDYVVTGNASASDTLTFEGYDAQGTVTTDGYVEHLLKTDTKNGWKKLETVASVGEKGTLTISLTAENGDLQLSDVTLLCNANTRPELAYVDEAKNPHYTYYPTIWTKAPTNSETTEYDLTDRHGANEFSFFDRGDNLNAVIYADKNTVLGMSENTYNVAVPTGYKSDDNSEGPSAKHGPVFRDISPGDKQVVLPFENVTGHALVWEDEPDAWVNNNTWGTSAQQITWDRFFWNRKFTGTSKGSGERNTIFLPFWMDENRITAIFGEGAKIYKITSVDAPKLTVEGTPVPGTDPDTGKEVKGTEPNVPYILQLPEAKDGVSYNDKLVTYYSKYDSKPTHIGTQGQFVGVYKYTNITSKSDGTYDYYGYDAESNGIFNSFSNEGADFKPFRAYLRIKRTDPSTNAKPFYYFVVKDDEATGIEDVRTTSLSEDAPVYNLQGQMIRQAGQHAPLPKGLYIQNGRKFVQQ